MGMWKLWPGTPQHLQVATRDLGGGVGALDLSGRGEKKEGAREAIARAMNELLGSGHLRIVVNVSRLEAIAVEAVGALLRELFRMQEAGGALALAGVPRGVRESFAKLDVLDRVPSHDSEAAAIAALRADPRPIGALARERLDISVVKVRSPQAGEYALLELRGALGDSEAPGLEEAMQLALAEMSRRIVVDCRDLLDLDPAHLIQAAKTIRKKGGRVHFARIGGVPAAIVRGLRLELLLPSYHDAEAAAVAFGAS